MNLKMKYLEIEFVVNDVTDDFIQILLQYTLASQAICVGDFLTVESSLYHIMTSSKVFLVLTVFFLGVHCQGVGFGQPCSVTNRCRSDLNCINLRCACRHPRHQSFDGSICVSQVLGPCGNETDNGVTIDIPCVANAECRNETGFPECACRSGTSLTARSCRALFGESCQTNPDCHNPSSSSENSVICRDGRCDCGNLQTFDEATGRCMGMVGAFCSTATNCVEGATCERFNSFDGICRCTGAFTVTPDRRCSLSQCLRV